MKTCCGCMEEKPVDEFYNNSAAKDGKNYWCKMCDSVKYAANRARAKGVPFDEINHGLVGYGFNKCRCEVCTTAKSADALRRRTERLDVIAQIKLERGCADCGYNEYSCALEFDHLPEYDKKFKIAALGRDITLSRLLEEIAKCDVVCAICHAIRTAIRGEHHLRQFGFWEE